MLSHEFFHEQAHLEEQHETKRRILLLIILSAIYLNYSLSIVNCPLSIIFAFLLYRLFCHCQEFEADKLAAKKCGKKAAIESLRLLQMREEKAGFWAGLVSLHPKTEKRIEVFLN